MDKKPKSQKLFDLAVLFDGIAAICLLFSVISFFTIDPVWAGVIAFIATIYLFMLAFLLHHNSEVAFVEEVCIEKMKYEERIEPFRFR